MLVIKQNKLIRWLLPSLIFFNAAVCVLLGYFCAYYAWVSMTPNSSRFGPVGAILFWVTIWQVVIELFLLALWLFPLEKVETKGTGFPIVVDSIEAGEKED